MGILKLKPACKDYLWGGHRLVDEYGVQYDGDVCAEAWVLSCHPDGPSTIVNGKYAGRTLQQFIDAEGKEVLGTNCRRFREFPILTKFIDAKQNLSIQVHPDNAYALKNENQYGKTEMWYVIDAEPGAFLYYGFKKEISREEFEERIKNNTLTEVLNAVHVKKGDALLIESGTLPQRVRAMCAIVIPVFAGAIRHADNLALALDARCYQEGVRRTLWHPLRMHMRDWVFCICIVATILAIIAVRVFNM